MALTKTVSLDGCNQFVYDYNIIIIKQNAELKLDDAYITVDSITGSKEKLQVCVKFVSNDIVHTQLYEFTPSTTDGAPNFIKQAYEYLKTLPEFSDAIDC